MTRRLPRGLSLRDGALLDVPSISKITRSKNNRLEFGYVMNVVLEAAIRDHLDAGATAKNRVRVIAEKEFGTAAAFYRAYHRRDGVTTLHEIGVAEAKQSQGLGTRLMNDLIAHCKKRKRSKIRLKTVSTSRSNQFYLRLGFRNVGQEKGPKRLVNVYELVL